MTSTTKPPSQGAHKFKNTVGKELEEEGQGNCVRLNREEQTIISQQALVFSSSWVNARVNTVVLGGSFKCFTEKVSLEGDNTEDMLQVICEGV